LRESGNATVIEKNFADVIGGDVKKFEDGYKPTAKANRKHKNYDDLKLLNDYSWCPIKDSP